MLGMLRIEDAACDLCRRRRNELATLVGDGLKEFFSPAYRVAGHASGMELLAAYLDLPFHEAGWCGVVWDMIFHRRTRNHRQATSLEPATVEFLLLFAVFAAFWLLVSVESYSSPLLIVVKD